MKIINLIKNREVFIPILIALVGFLIYANNLGNTMFWDDKAFIFDNVHVQSFNWENIKHIFTHDVIAAAGQKSNYYRPFLQLTFMANYIIHGAKPLGYHLVNNLIHVGSALLILFLLNRLFRKFWLAAFVSLVFVLHPLNSESVSYVAARGDVLAIFFQLLALYLLEIKRFRILTYPILVLALLTRETSIIFPFLAMIYLMVVSKEKFLNSLKNAFIKALPYFGVVLVYGILRLTLLNFYNTLNFHPGANDYYTNIFIRIYTFLHVIIEYLILIFYPHNLHVRFEGPIHRSFTEFPVWLSFSGIILLFFFLSFLYKKKKEDFKIWFFGTAWFFVNLGPTSGILAPINAIMQEHWVYLAMIGVYSIVFFYFGKLLKIVKKKLKPIFFSMVFLFIAYSLFLGIATIKRNVVWGDPIAFFEDFRKYEVGNARILNNMGKLYSERRNLEKATEYYLKAVAFSPDFPEPYFNLGNAYVIAQNFGEAVLSYKKAIEIDPKFTPTYEILANIYEANGDIRESLNYWEKLIEVSPEDAVAYYNAGVLSYHLKDLTKARIYLEKALAASKSQSLSTLTQKLLRELKGEE